MTVEKVKEEWFNHPVISFTIFIVYLGCVLLRQEWLLCQFTMDDV
jgi:hypothetical protein